MHEITQAVVDTYSEITDTSCSSFGVYSEDGEHTKIAECEVCHASMKEWQANTFDHLITAYPTQMHPEVHLDVWLRFFDFMKNTLYKQWKDQIHLESAHDTEGTDYWIHVSELGKIPANVLFNLCICSRSIIENPSNILRWVEMCDQGIHPSIAFSLCKSKLDNDGVIYELNLGNHHWPIDMCSSLTQLVTGAPRVFGPSYKKFPCCCTPCNNIWGITYDLKPAIGKTPFEFWTNWKQEHEDILLTS